MKKQTKLALLVLLASFLFVVPSFAEHGGKLGCVYWGRKDYYVTEAKWTAYFDSEVFDLEILAYENLWFDAEVKKTDTSVSVKASTALKIVSGIPPEFWFSIKENANPGTYSVCVFVTEPNGNQIDSKKYSVLVEPHDYSIFVEKVNVTCITDGHTKYACSCGSTVKKEMVSSLGHDWGKWSVVKEATTTEEGQEQRTCDNNSSHVETRPIEKLTYPGDANNDSAIDIMDLVSIIDYIVSDTTPMSLTNADANGDGAIDILDLVWIIDQIVGG